MGAKEQSGRTWSSFHLTRGTMYIKRLAENLVQKALLLFEILSFEVYCRSDSDSPTQRYGESATLRINDTRMKKPGKL